MLSLLGRVDFASKASKRRERCITEVIFCFAKLYVPAASWFATVGDGALDVPKNGSYICLSASDITLRVVIFPAEIILPFTENSAKRLAKNIIYCYNNDEHSFAFVVFITTDF